MKMINEITAVIKKRSFPSFIDELYKRNCELLDLQHIEETEEGYLYLLSIGSDNLKRFEEFISIINSAGDKYKIISAKNVLEERALGGLINVSGRLPVENMADFKTWVTGAAGFIHEKIYQASGLAFTGISRSVCLVSGIQSGKEGEHELLLCDYADAERDAVILNRFAGLNGYPVTVRYDHPEDIVKVLKLIGQNFSAVRIMHVDQATLMLYDLLLSELAVPIVSIEYDDIPLYLLALVLKILIKHRLKPEETTIGFVGVDLSAVRLARVLKVIRFRRVLGFDQSEKNMLALESQGGLATTAENIFSNADITVLLKSNYNREELLKIRPGQFVISFLPEEQLDMEIISGKGIREFVGKDPTVLAALFPGILRGVIESGLRTISDLKLIEYSKKIAGLLNDSFEFPNLFSDIHDKVCLIIRTGAAKE